ncbi:hypothetical protein BAG01nite_47600 [Brevibacillus agri]|uniref:Uncharacterized protein n=2 Tax=Brevibacillus agri TaxID=51101 RepID=A0A3M8ALB0_9BACL|nr:MULTISPECIES: hypothetical protein [Brevibacillus]MCG5252946.1 hypothetical protein [Brevibacillus agri]MDN4095608.1 hypothetical protein [Brevibacillus agri]QAV15759.1 hypothetical protein BA6348_25175 [Brevibacillus agri]QHZ58445.1 hypothetical protein M655_023945 [Brevibacillus sp. NSP2.1]RNB51971.1 hypothetical protein EB820_19385 [Brevibacillus agri]
MNQNQNIRDVKLINKAGKTGLTREEKEIMKQMKGSVTSPFDLDSIRERIKYGDQEESRDWKAENRTE